MTKQIDNLAERKQIQADFNKLRKENLGLKFQLKKYAKLKKSMMAIRLLSGIWTTSESRIYCEEEGGECDCSDCSNSYKEISEDW